MASQYQQQQQQQNQPRSPATQPAVSSGLDQEQYKLFLKYSQEQRQQHQNIPSAHQTAQRQDHAHSMPTSPSQSQPQPQPQPLPQQQQTYPPHQQHSPSNQNQHGLNRSGFPDPIHPFEVDEFGVPYYTKPIPAIDFNSAIIYHAIEPHVNYFFYTAPRTNNYGAKVVYINPWKSADSAVRMNIQLCEFDEPMRAPWGASPPMSKDGKTPGTLLRPGFSLSVDNPRLQELFVKWDNKTRHTALTRGAQWFGPGTKAAVIEGNYTTMLSAPSASSGTDQQQQQQQQRQPSQTEKKFPPTLRTKVILGDVAWATKVFFKTGENEDKSWNLETVPNVTCELLGPENRYIPVVEISSMWFMGKSQYGTNVICTNLIVLPRSQKPSGSFYGITTHIVPQAPKQIAYQQKQPCAPNSRQASGYGSYGEEGYVNDNGAGDNECTNDPPMDEGNDQMEESRSAEV